MLTLDPKEAPVKTEDSLALAIEAAKARAAVVYAKGRMTLVDTISLADFAAWDATDEIALVGAKTVEEAEDDELYEHDFVEFAA